MPSSTGTLALTSDIPQVGNGVLDIQKNGTRLGTFTANAMINKTINITVPTKTSDITNDSGFITSADLPAAVSGTNDGTNWLTITIGNDTYNIPAGGGSADGFDFIILNSSAASGTFTAAELARIADHPQRCVIVKYGGSAKWVQSYQLREIAYTDDSQTTVDTYTFGYIQTTSETKLKDRKIVVTAATGDWVYSQVDIKVVTSNTDQTISGVKTFSSGIKANYITSNSILRLISADGRPVWIGGNNDLVPYNDGTQNLGSSSDRWRDLYLTGFITDGTHSVAVTNIADKSNSETWTFTLADGTTTTKTIVLG